MERLRLRPFEDEDVDLLRRWLAREHVARWYEDPEDWIAEAQGRHGPFAWIRYFIAACGEVDIGFCQYYPYEKSGEDWHGSVETEGTFSLDYLIGEPDYLGRGMGRAIVESLLSRIAEEPGARRVIGLPDQDNAASCHTLMSAGFRYDGENRLYLLEL